MKILNIQHYITRVVPMLLVLLIAASCDDLVDESPISEIDPNNLYKNNSDALVGVIGMYDAMQPTFRLKHYLWGEFRSDNYINGNEGATANYIELTTNDITSGNSPVLRWNDFYDLVNRANYAIANIPEIDGYDSNLLAEAQAMRAYAYFQAVRVWGSVPLFTEPVKGSGPELQKTRTDATTIINDVILPDMLAAEDNMNLMSDPYRFSLTSIWALQAEVYGYLGEDEKARTALQNIVDSQEFSLTTSPEAWQNLFLNDDGEGTGPLKVQTGPELIMSIAFSLNETAGTGNANRSGIFSLFFAGIPSYTISPKLENMWREKFPIDSLGWVTKYPDTDPMLTETDVDGNESFIYGDYRYYFSREGGTSLETKEIGEARVAKYNKMNYSATLDDSDIVLYRYANVILYLAELENRLLNEGRALELINEFRTARQLPLVTADEFGATMDERELFILDERQLELLGEAQRWWDLRRTKRALEIMNPVLDTLDGGVPLTDERLLFPIYDEHMVENPELVQTPGY